MPKFPLLDLDLAYSTSSSEFNSTLHPLTNSHYFTVTVAKTQRLPHTERATKTNTCC